MKEKKYRLRPMYLENGGSNNTTISLLNKRLGRNKLPQYYKSDIDGADQMAKTLIVDGGLAQQNRMIKDKRHSLDQATKYSYQAALVRKCIPNGIECEEEKKSILPVRALINPNKLKQDYDDKIISIGFEHNFHTGDVFEWCNTGTHWLIYLQDLEELAYFRGDIRKCSYQIPYLDENGELQVTYAAIRGPVETKINFIQKHKDSLDVPNYSINFLIPKNEATLEYFKRYHKFYLWPAGDEGIHKTCWRVEAVDNISTPNIINVNAVEYYGNPQLDDLDSGLAEAFGMPIEIINSKIVEQNKAREKIIYIVGETFIKPKRDYIYTIGANIPGEWNVDSKYPVKLTPFINKDGKKSVTLQWTSSYHGQFDLTCGDKKKTIVVESLY